MSVESSSPSTAPLAVNSLTQSGLWAAQLADRLTERQKAYIRKLGLTAQRSGGREIIPIDLGLYRELMHLEIVVDKGRRVALTALGRELCQRLNEKPVTEVLEAGPGLSPIPAHLQ